MNTNINNSNRFPFPVVTMDELPVHLRERRNKGHGKWEWLRLLIVKEMGPEALSRGKSVKRIEFPNQNLASSAQSAAQGVSPKKRANQRGTHVITAFPKDSLYTLETRTEPVVERGGAYFLFIKVAHPLRHN